MAKHRVFFLLIALAAVYVSDGVETCADDADACIVEGTTGLGEESPLASVVHTSALLQKDARVTQKEFDKSEEAGLNQMVGSDEVESGVSQGGYSDNGAEKTSSDDQAEEEGENEEEQEEEFENAEDETEDEHTSTDVDVDVVEVLGKLADFGCCSGNIKFLLGAVSDTANCTSDADFKRLKNGAKLSDECCREHDIAISNACPDFDRKNNCCPRRSATQDYVQADLALYKCAEAAKYTVGWKRRRRSTCNKHKISCKAMQLGIRGTFHATPNAFTTIC